MNTKHQKSQEGRVFRLSPHCYKSKMAREVMRWIKAEWYWRWRHACFCPADLAVMPSFQVIFFDCSKGEKEKEKRNCIWLFNEEENIVSIILYWILKKGSPAFCVLSDSKAWDVRGNGRRAHGYGSHIAVTSSFWVQGKVCCSQN